MGWKFSTEPFRGHEITVAGKDADMSQPDSKLYERQTTDDLLDVLLDARELDPLKTTAADTSNPHREVVRSLARLTDATKLLHAAGALIIARAGSINRQAFVSNPVPMTVNGRAVAGQGEILFVWALPVGGTSLKASEPPALRLCRRVLPARSGGNRSAPTVEAP